MKRYRGAPDSGERSRQSSPAMRWSSLVRHSADRRRRNARGRRSLPRQTSPDRLNCGSYRVDRIPVAHFVFGEPPIVARPKLGPIDPPNWAVGKLVGSWSRVDVTPNWSSESASPPASPSVVARLVVVVQAFVAVATECSTNRRLWRRGIHAASRRTRSRRRPAAPKSSLPAPHVSAPPSNSATTGRPSTRPNTPGSALHSVCIGLPLRMGKSRYRKTTYA